MKDTTKEILRKFGWYEGRDVNIDAIIKYYETGTDIVFEPVKKFLREFGFLRIDTEDLINYDTDKYGNRMKEIDTREIDINPINFIIKKYYNDQMKDLEEEFNEKMMEVGIIESGMYRLAVSENGKVYYEEGFLADNFDDAWDKLVEHVYY